MSKLSERLLECRNKKRVTQTEAAKRIGVSREALSQWESGGIPEIKAANLIAAAKYYGVPPEWLQTGRRGQTENHEGISADQFAEIPVLTLKASAGGGYLPHYIEVSGGHAYTKDYLRAKGIKNGDGFRHQIEGDSMTPTLYHGDWALVNGGDKTIRNNGVYVFQIKGEVMVKRFFWLPGDSLEIRSDNEKYKPWVLTHEQADDFEVLGRVVDRSGSGGL